MKPKASTRSQITSLTFMMVLSNHRKTHTISAGSNLSHSAGDTTSALNRISAFNFDFAITDWVRFSKSSYHGVIKANIKKCYKSATNLLNPKHDKTGYSKQETPRKWTGINSKIMEERLYYAPQILRSKRKKHSMNLYILPQ